MKQFLAALFLALVPLSAAAQIKIIGPATIPVGGMALLKLEGAKRGDAFDFFAAPTSAVLVLLYDGDDTPVGVINGGKAEALTIVAVRYDAETKKIERSLHALVVGTPGPNPPDPDPDPPGPPGPPTPVPDGKLGFTKLSYNAALALPATAKSHLPALADNFEGVASAIAAGAIRSVDEAEESLAKKNLATVGASNRAVFLPFFTAWQNHADAANKAGTLSRAAVATYAEVYAATADGLRRVK